MAFDNVIVPWLGSTCNLRDEEIMAISWDNMSLLDNPELPPLFSDSKILFELVGLMLENDLVEIGTEILKYMRVSIFTSSTYAILIASLHTDNDFDENPGKLSIFEQILKIWFPRPIDIVVLIHNLVDLRMGEDFVLLLIDLTWERIVNYRPATYVSPSNNLVDLYFSKILMSAMWKQYVSVFEDILERRPNLIEFIHQDVRRKSTIIHQFCFGDDPRTLNKIKVVKGSRNPTAPERSSSPHIRHFSVSVLYADHRARSYPKANADLLAIMLRFGADINARDCNDYTPLHAAIRLKNAHIFRVLIEAGADYTVTVNGMNIYAFIISNYSSEVEKVFYELIPRNK